ncbi:MAG: hypothetical protein KUG73_13810 [Pseudomonadales bacterium]|nr:hypothetical protein [Pseudomonadales bacterium]
MISESALQAQSLLRDTSHSSNFAPMWAAPGGDTAYLILIGLNIEISFMFAITGIAATLAIPKDKHAKILGLNNRLVFASVMSDFPIRIYDILSCLLLGL